MTVKQVRRGGRMGGPFPAESEREAQKHKSLALLACTPMLQVPRGSSRTPERQRCSAGALAAVHSALTARVAHAERACG